MGVLVIIKVIQASDAVKLGDLTAGYSGKNCFVMYVIVLLLQRFFTFGVVKCEYWCEVNCSTLKTTTDQSASRIDQLYPG